MCNRWLSKHSRVDFLKQTSKQANKQTKKTKKRFSSFKCNSIKWPPKKKKHLKKEMKLKDKMLEASASVERIQPEKNSSTKTAQGA